MPGDIVSLQVGQCGNEIGHEFWKRICDEHGITVDGEAIPDQVVEDNRCTFFSSDDNGRYIPRAVLIDLEPRVINSITNGEFERLYNAERVFECSDGGGAGNNWATGFGAAEKQQNEIGDKIMDMIREEVELCERCDGLNLFHSIAGGTGSGLGSWILEHISDYFETKLALHTFSVFPGEKSDVVVQPYNAILTLARLIEFSDLTVVLENETITQTAMKKMRIANPSMQDINSIIGRVMAGITAPIRFGSPVFGSFSGIATQLSPVHPLHFVQCGVAPMIPIGSKFPQRTQATDLMQVLSKPESIMTNPFQKFNPGPTDCLVSGLAIFQGNVLPQEVANATYMTNLNQPYGAPLLPFCDIQYCTTYPQAKNRTAVLAVNHSNFTKTVEVIEKQYSAMYKSKAYLKSFEKEEYFAEGMEPLQEAHAKVKELAAAYSEPWQFCSTRRGDIDD